MKNTDSFYPCDFYFVSHTKESVAADSLTQEELADKLTAMQLAFIRRNGFEIVPDEQ